MKINKKYKIWKFAGVEDLRPALAQIKFSNGYAYVTDGHILLKIAVYHLFEYGRKSTRRQRFDVPMPNEDINTLNGKYMHAEVYAKAMAHKGPLCITDAGFESIDEAAPITYGFTRNDINYPNVESVIEQSRNSEQESMDNLRFMSSTLGKIIDALNISIVDLRIKKDHTVRLNIDEKDTSFDGEVFFMRT